MKKLFLFLIIILFGFPAFAQDIITAHTMKGCDDQSRLYPVWTKSTDEYISGRFLIPDASGTSVHMAPIDTRAVKQLMFQWTAGNPSDTTATIGGALSLYGSCLAADSPIGNATYMTTDTDISRLPIIFADIEHGPIIDSTSAYFAKRVITSGTPGLQYVDTSGVAWVKPLVASKTVGNMTMNLFYYGLKEK